MGIRQFKPVTAGRRQMSVSDFAEITDRKKAPEKSLVVRVKKAYPYYDSSYKENVATIAGYLEGAAPNVHLVGRNGMHKYNNQDHAMMTAMLTGIWPFSTACNRRSSPFAKSFKIPPT